MAKRFAEVSMTIPVYFTMEYDDEQNMTYTKMRNTAFNAFDAMEDSRKASIIKSAYLEAAYINSIRDCETGEELYVL